MAENGIDWTPNQRKYMVWLSTPEDKRTSHKHSAFAHELGVGERSLYRWQNLPGFWAEVNKLVEEHLADDFAEVTQALRRQAKLGSIQHIRTYLEMIGKYVPRMIMDHRHTMIEEAKRLAAQEGLDEADVIAEAERIMAGKD